MQQWHAKEKAKPQADANDGYLPAVSKPQLDRCHPENAKCYGAKRYHANYLSMRLNEKNLSRARLAARLATETKTAVQLWLW